MIKASYVFVRGFFGKYKIFEGCLGESAIRLRRRLTGANAFFLIRGK